MIQDEFIKIRKTQENNNYVKHWRRETIFNE